MPIFFSDPISLQMSVPLHLWIQAGHVYLGPMTGVRVYGPHGGTGVPFGFGVGSAIARNTDLRAWFLFPDLDHSGQIFGFGVGLEVRF